MRNRPTWSYGVTLVLKWAVSVPDGLLKNPSERKGVELGAGNGILQQPQGWEITGLEMWQLGIGVV